MEVDQKDNGTIIIKTDKAHKSSGITGMNIDKEYPFIYIKSDLKSNGGISVEFYKDDENKLRNPKISAKELMGLTNLDSKGSVLSFKCEKNNTEFKPIEAGDYIVKVSAGNSRVTGNVLIRCGRNGDNPTF